MFCPFEKRFETLAGADVAVVAVDATESLTPLDEQVTACRRVVSEYVGDSTVTTLTKVDQVDSEAVAEMTETLENDIDIPVVPVSVHAESYIDALTEEIRAALPERERYRLQLPLTDDAMSLVSRIHDEAHVHETTYDAEAVTIDFEARSETVAKVREQADALQQ